MKRGDKFPVTIQGITVCQAEVTAVETDKVTLVVPATKVVMGVRMQFDETPSTPSEPEKQVLIEGVDRPSDTDNTPVEAPAVEAPSVEAPAVETPTTNAAAPVDNPETVVTPPADTTTNTEQAEAPVQNTEPS